MRGQTTARLLAPMAALWIAAAETAFAQQPPGTISGVVEELPGLPPGTVRVENIATKFSWSASTDGGRFSVTGLPPGTYRVLFVGVCYEPLEQQVALALGKEHRITFKPQEVGPARVTIVDADTQRPLKDATVRFRGKAEPAITDDNGTVTRDCGSLFDASHDVKLDSAGGGLPLRSFFSVRKRDYHPARGSVNLIGTSKVTNSGTNTLHGSARYMIAGEDWSTSNIPDDVANDSRLRGGEFALAPMTVPEMKPGFLIGVDAGVDGIDSLDPSRIQDTSTFILNGRQEDQTSNTVPNGQHAGVFGNSSKATGFGPWIVHNSGLFGSGPSKAIEGAAGARAPRTSARRATTSFRVGVVRTEEELEYDKLDDATPGGRDTTWKGSGMAVRAGVDQSFRLGGRLLLRLGYDHERLLETDVTRSPGLQPAGGRLLRDEGRLSRQTHVARIALGWSGRHLSPWAGVRLSRETLRLTGEAAAEFDIPQGLVEQRISFVNEFKANRVMADFGLDVRIPRTRVFLRAQVATDGSRVRFGLSASHGWFRGR